MGSEISIYSVAVIGFERDERHFLRRMLSLAVGCQPSFKPFDKSLGGCPHLILVDATAPGAMRSWHEFQRAHARRGSFVPIFVGSHLAQMQCPDLYMLQRPVKTKALFTVLERAVTEVHGFGGGTAGGMEERGTPGINALVVDGSPRVQEQMRGALDSIAYRLDFASTGAQALELLAVSRYSVIFLDGTLPDEGAYDLSGRIKKHPLQQQAVVVMLTPSASPADRVMGALAGFDNYLLKPIEPETFNNLVAEIVRPAAAL
jgi:CheY-like chemotaxis protein